MKNSTKLHSFIYEVTLDAPCGWNSSLFVYLWVELGMPSWMKKTLQNFFHSFTTRPWRALLIKKTLQASSFTRRRVWMPSWMKNSTKLLHSFTRHVWMPLWMKNSTKLLQSLTRRAWMPLWMKHSTNIFIHLQGELRFMCGWKTLQTFSWQPLGSRYRWKNPFHSLKKTTRKILLAYLFTQFWIWVFFINVITSTTLGQNEPTATTN